MTQIIYIGRRKLNGGKPGLGFITVDQLANFDRDSGYYPGDQIDRIASFFAFKKKPTIPLVIGLIYEAEDLKLSENGSIDTISAAKLKLLTHSNSEFTADWRAKDDALEQEKRVASAAKRKEDSSDLARAVDTLKRHYKLISPGYRRGFQFWLMNELEKK